MRRPAAIYACNSRAPARTARRWPASQPVHPQLSCGVTTSGNASSPLPKAITQPRQGNPTQQATNGDNAPTPARQGQRYRMAERPTPTATAPQQGNTTPPALPKLIVSRRLAASKTHVNPPHTSESGFVRNQTGTLMHTPVHPSKFAPHTPSRRQRQSISDRQKRRTAIQFTRRRQLNPPFQYGSRKSYCGILIKFAYHPPACGSCARPARRQQRRHLRQSCRPTRTGVGSPKGKTTFRTPLLA